MEHLNYEKFSSYIQKILNLNFCVFITIILLNLMIFIGVLDIDLNYLLHNQLIAFLIQNSLFPEVASDSLQLTLLVSLFLFIINVFSSIFLVLYYLGDKGNLLFDKLKRNNKILYILGFRAIYPAEYHKLINDKSTLFKVASLPFYILILFTAMEWFIWFDVLLMPFWLFKLISNFQFFLFLWNIFLIVVIGFFCPNVVGLSIVLVYSIFRRES